MQLAVIENEDKLVTTVGSLCEAAGDVVVRNADELSNATDLVKLIKTRHKEIDAERDALVRPLNGTVDKINAKFKTILAPLKTAEEGVKAKMLAFQQEEARKAEALRREAERKAQEAAEEASRLAAESDRPDLPVAVVAPVAVAPEPAKTTYGSYGGVSTVKKTWAWELLDIQALAAARPDLVTVDAVKVNAEIRGQGGEIPGLRIYQNETIAVR